MEGKEDWVGLGVFLCCKKNRKWVGKDTNKNKRFCWKRLPGLTDFVMGFG